MKHLDDFETYSINEESEILVKPVKIQVLGKSMDMSTSKKKAYSNVKHIADMLDMSNKYEVVDEKVEKKDDKYLSKITILLKMSSKKIKSLENSIAKFDNAPFSIV